MNCPACKTELKMADRQGVEIDYCPQCRGVWLDRGELDKIIERSAQTGSVRETPEAVPGRRISSTLRWQGEKKSVLGEMFDLD